jgi:hypothetical protein
MLSGVDEDERRRRAKFCRRYSGEAAAAARSLWFSESERQDFLGRCVPPPLEGWTAPPAAVSVADFALLEEQADAIEPAYLQSLRDADRRRQIIFFGRSV